MMIWVPTDSRYVKKGITRWIKNWKWNGWCNARVATVANTTLWRTLDEAVQRHVTAAVLDDTIQVQAAAWNQRLTDSARKTQNYDKGLERFVHKFDPEEEMEAVIAVANLVHQDHGLAVYATQRKRRCLLLGTIFGHTDEDALWYTLMWWACLQPRKK
jgi:hypothetical protein